MAAVAAAVLMVEWVQVLAVKAELLEDIKAKVK